MTSELILERHGVRVERVVTSGTVGPDGGTWAVDNNIYLVGDDTDVVVIDAAHAARPIVDAVTGRHVNAVMCTHGHDDHVTVAPELGYALHAPVLLHPADDVLWKQSHPDVTHWTLDDGRRIAIGGTELEVIHTPGHSPGSVCLHLPELGVLFSGDTLFPEGADGTGRFCSDSTTVIGSVHERLLALDEDTVVLTGHGIHSAFGSGVPHITDCIVRES